MRADDAELVRRIREGKQEFFDKLVARHAASVFRLVRAAVRQQADAEDLAQETFLACYRALPRLEDPQRFRAYLLSIAARKVADFIRARSRRRPPDPLLEDPPGREEPAERNPDLAAVVERIVDGLSPPGRLVFALRHQEGLSCVQIAHILDEPEGTIYSRLSRIHQAIRQAAKVRER